VCILRDLIGVDPLALYISRDAARDWLTALPLGCVSDSRLDDHYVYVGEAFRWRLDAPGGRVIGFEVVGLRDFDADDPVYSELWRGPRFTAPLLALTSAYAGEIVVAARARFEAESTLNRIHFDLAVGADGEEAVEQWRLCLASGDSMAHFGLGSALLEVGRPREAYAHLRHYTEIDPTNAWAWCWLGRASAKLGRIDDARRACRRAVALEEAGAIETDARELLEQLGERSSQRRR
jgi:tetratricopeptide (TPR) repeat protein